MSITEIEDEIKKLPTAKLDELARWFGDYHADLWDKQIAEDLENGRFDAALSEIDVEIAAGLAKPL